MPQKKIRETVISNGRKTEEIVVDGPLQSPIILPNRRFTEYKTTPECYNKVALDSPLLKNRNMALSADVLNSSSKGFSKELGLNSEDSSTILVGVRVRPFTSRELEEEDVKCIVSMKGNETTLVTEKGETHRFTYDHSFWSFDPSSHSHVGQSQVFEILARPLLTKVLEGYNTCLFAYGQTSSGKSYSIMGHGGDEGVIPRFSKELFDTLNNQQDSQTSYIVELSYFEIYNEKIHDLLGSSLNKEKITKKPNLRVREHPVIGPYVEGLSSYLVKNFDDVSTWVAVGNKRRATATTGLNDNSSRSHSVFTLVITQTKTSVIEGSEHRHNVTSKMNLVDLAGSERQSTAKTTGERLREGASINKSLMALGKVINVLSDLQPYSSSKRKHFIPYRETVLTWLLKESLGGNSKTTMLATISPSNHNQEETLSTLRYARQARSIMNVAKINEDPNAKIIRSLQAEIEKLKQLADGIGNYGNLINGKNNDVHETNKKGREVNEEMCLSEIKLLKEELMRKEKEMIEINNNWLEKLKQSEACKELEAKSLEKTGLSLKMDISRPCIVNLNEDPQLNEVLVYGFKKGVTKLGHETGSLDLDIQLSGHLVASQHCYFECNENDEVVSMTTLNMASSYLNGDLLDNNKSIILHDGDRIVIGDHFFRFLNPKQPKTASSISPNGSYKDFYFAYHEFTTKQNARLEAELALTRQEHQVQLKKLESEKNNEKESLKQQLIDSNQKKNDLEKLYNIKFEQLNKMICEQSCDYMGALDKIEALKREVQNLERKLNLSQVTQKKLEEQLDSLNNNNNNNNSNNNNNINNDIKGYCSDFLDFFKKAKQNVNESLKNEKLTVTPDNSCQVFMMLQEANKISETLNIDVKFSKDWDEEGSMVIKLLKRDLKLTTFWSLTKFQDKLQCIRDLYKEGGEGIDELFVDPRDTWESESKLNLSPSNHFKHIRRSISSYNTNLDITLGSNDLSFSINPGVYADSPAGQYDKPMGGSCLFNIFGDFIKLSLSCLEGPKELTPCDQVLFYLHQISSSSSNIHQSASNQDEALDLTVNSQLLLSLVHSYSLLQMACSYWTVRNDNTQSENFDSICDHMTKLLKQLAVQIQFFFQSLECKIKSLLDDSFDKIININMELCKKAGNLAMICRTSCDYSLKSLTLDNQPYPYNQTIRGKLKKNFIIGCNEFLEDALRIAMESLTQSETQFQLISFDKNTLVKKSLKTASAAISIIKKIQFIYPNISSADLSYCDNQENIIDNNIGINNNDININNNKDYYLNAYKRCRELCEDVSEVFDVCLQLLEMVAHMSRDPSLMVESTGLKNLLESLSKHASHLISSKYLNSNQDNFLTNISFANKSVLDDYLTQEQSKALDSELQNLNQAVLDLTIETSTK